MLITTFAYGRKDTGKYLMVQLTIFCQTDMEVILIFVYDQKDLAW